MSDKFNRNQCSRKVDVDRPKKPYSDFPLGPAHNGFWQKRIKGKLFYFGCWGRVQNGKVVRICEDGCW